MVLLNVFFLILIIAIIALANDNTKLCVRCKISWKFFSSVNNVFGKLVQTEWISQISFSNMQEADIKSCFDCPLEFYYSKNINKLDSLLEEFKLKTENVDNNDTNSTNSYGENIKTNCLIVMDNVSGPADKSNNFAGFLEVGQKFKYNCVHIFQIIYPEKSIWKLILSQTSIFNTFPGSTQQSSVMKVLQANCIRETICYLTQNSIWINRLFITLANKK